jgi:hypothetical protein
MTLIPNPWGGRLCFLFCGGVVAGTGIMPEEVEKMNIVAYSELYLVVRQPLAPIV